LAQDLIRNFSIVAHIDHGKSTLADRLLEATGAVDSRRMKEQVLDSMDLERERGITIKLNAVRLPYRARDGREYELNLIDTPGHVDFTYEVSRSLEACEGALLVVDASQGIEAQTISNLFLALHAGLEIIPILNKIDLPAAEPERRRDEVCDLIGVEPEDVLLASAKEGTGVAEILEAIVHRIPPPSGDPDAPLRALIFDSVYDKYRGAVPFLRVVDGWIRKDMVVGFGASDAEYQVDEAGFMRLGFQPTGELRTGEVGYLTAQIKRISDTRVGDTVLDATNRASELLPGYQEAKPVVFAGLYPTDSDQFEELRDALAKLQLSDASLHWEPETSTALGFGFLTLTNGDRLSVENPSRMPDRGRLEAVEEPYVRIHIVSPSEYIGAIQKLCHERRGEYLNLEYLDPDRVELRYDVPLAEIVLDFYDRLKSVSRGYAALDYELAGYRESDLVKLDILLNGEPVDALSVIVHRDEAYEYGRKMASKLKQLIPRQLFDVAIQAAIGRDVISRTNVKALRKNVTAKCYGGDITRKRKLLEKQKEGKRRMKQVGSVEIPQEAFLAVLQVGD
jgi:GTP-binding protein LepA